MWPGYWLPIAPVTIMKALPSCMVVTVARREGTRWWCAQSLPLLSSVLYSRELFYHRTQFMLPLSMDVVSPNVSVLCCAFPCVQSHPYRTGARRWTLSDWPYLLPLHSWRQFLNWKEAGFWNHWNGSVPVWLYWSGTKLSGSVYRCNPQHWASRRCYHVWNTQMLGWSLFMRAASTLPADPSLPTHVT